MSHDLKDYGKFCEFRMLIRKRVIPVLLIHKGGLYKSVKFGKYKYVGDPINAVRIFNDKEVDELVILDIDASKSKRGPALEQITEIVSEAFMPVAYGGGINTIEQASALFYNGVEKVILNSSILVKPELITQIAEQFGSQSIIASIDYKAKRIVGGNKVYSHADVKHRQTEILSFVKLCEKMGAGEILLNCVDRDGTYQGYDSVTLKQIADAVSIPVIACGGASTKDDFIKAMEHNASAMAAGSMFVFQRPNQAVLISYQSFNE